MTTVLNQTQYLRRYGIAIASVLIALLLIVAVDPFLQLTQASFLLFVGAVAISALYGGCNPGIVATLLSAGFANYFFLEPRYSWSLTLASGLRLVIFILEGVLISVLVGALHTTQAQLRQNVHQLKATEADVKDLNQALQRQVDERQALAAAHLASEDRYRVLVESIDEGFCLCEMLVDEDGTPVDYRFLEVNSVFEPLTGLQQVVGKTARELVPDLEEFWVETYGRAALTREAIRFKQRSTSMQHWFDVYAFPVGEPQRHLFGILFTNIAARKVVEQERERFLAVSSDLQVITSIDGYFQWVSPTFERILGWTAEEMTSRPWTEFVHPDDIGKSITETDHLFSGSETVAFENRYRHKDGSYRWFLWNAQPYPEEQVIYGAAVDISDRKQIEMALTAQEQRYRYIFEAVGVSIWEEDFSEVKSAITQLKTAGVQDFRQYFADHPEFVQQAIAMVRLRDVNQASLQLFGAQTKTELLTTLHRIFVPETYEVFVEELLTIASEKTHFVAETTLRNLQGQLLQVWMSITFPVPSEPYDRVIVSLLNISDRKQAEMALREKEQQLQQLSDSMPQFIWVCNAQGKLEYVNLKWVEYSGLTIEQSQNPQQIAELYHPDDRQAAFEQWAIALETSQPFELEARLQQAVDQTYRWFLIRAVPQFSEQGQVLRWIGTSTDIHDRKLAQLNEQFLKELDLQLRQLSDVEEMQWEVVSRLGQYLQVDRSVWDQIDAIAGMVTVKQDWRRQELPSIVGSYRLSDFILPELINLFYAGQPVTVSDVMSYPYTAPFADNFRAMNTCAFISIPCLYEGHWIATLTLSSQTVRHWQPNEVALLQEIVARLWLIIEQTRAFQALHQSEERLRIANERFEFAAKAVNCLIYDWYLESDRIERTDGLTKLFGYSLEEAEPTGQWWADRIHPEDLQVIREQAQSALAEEDYFCAEYRILNKSNQYVYVLDNCLVVERNQDGKPTRIVGSTIDISDRKQVEQEREQLLARERATREQAEAANRIKDEFLAVVSHELRSPLNPILGWSKLLQTRQLDEQKTQLALNVIARNAQIQAQLINDLLDVSRILRGKLSLNQISVDLVSIIQAALETVHLAAEAKSIQINTVLEPEVGKVSGDPDRLQQVVWNLLSNAVKFTPQGGQVNIQLERLGTDAQIIITDTGKGIHPDFLPYVFERFRQEDAATTRQFGGLGLGLALVRYLVELHGGTVKAESPGEGQGATFTVKLPLSSLHQPTINRQIEPSQPGLDLNSIRILVVDDDNNTREFIAFLLELHGANVIAVATADDAISTLVQFKPDLLLSDIGMPNMDGYMLMQQVRALPNEQGGQVPAIALTAYASEIDYQQAMAVGFQKHIVKPVEPETLVAAIAELVMK